jgi:DNA-3-methyladenine glycosylase I
MLIKIQEEFGSFNKYIWAFVNFTPVCNSWKTENEVPASTKLSDLISKDLKKRGFKFLGTTTVYAYMQAIGIVNDHVTSCFCYKRIKELQKEFEKAQKNK